MGNLALCAPSSICNAGVVKVLSSDGRLIAYAGGPVRAADIMLENPGQFLCESTSLRVGERIPGMRAEEELESGQEYFLLPIEMLYSVLTDEEMTCIITHKASSKGMKHLLGAGASLNISKFFRTAEFCLFPNASSSEADNGATEDPSSIVGVTVSGSHQLGRYSRQRSWQPALETIAETPPLT